MEEEQPESVTVVSTKHDDDEDENHELHQHHPAASDMYVDHSTLSTTETAKLMHGLNIKAADESVISAITDHASLECPSTTTALPSMLLDVVGGSSNSSSSSSQEVPRQVILADEHHHPQQHYQQKSSLPDEDVAANKRHHRHHQTPSDIPVSSSYGSQDDDGIAAEAASATAVLIEATTTEPTRDRTGDVPRTIQATTTSSSPQRGGGGEHHRSISMTHAPSPQREHLRSISVTEGMPLVGAASKAVTPAATSSPQKTEQEQQQQKDHLQDEDDGTDENAEGRDRYGYQQHHQDVYIQSPEIQNAIVERSPGGRYVRFMEKLGSGASKDVYRAYDTQEGIEVAWNVVTLSGVPKSERNRIVNEVRLLERLHHVNIISFHGSWVNRERQEVNFVTEILSSGTLKSFINKVQVIRWKIAKRWGVQILKGLEYLHSQQPPVIHRDLKCENIFINGTSGDLRIGDLGLSTVHRNGRVLSVLGTPEFMAPDMYEEDSYDEKVDIYAFGMVMLEIFTKQIPYSECSNPAQIYKKVSAGETPEILSRLQSRHAREFVMLCLGHRDEKNGKYVRPSASELLQHPFLERRPTDDDEVVVEKPLRERAIVEQQASSGGGGGDSLNASPDATPSSKRKVYASDQQGGGGGGSNNNNNNNTSASQSLASNSASNSLAAPTPPPPRRKNRLNSFEDDDDGDRFDEMPESETNMKKVKVLMGRGQELQEDDDAEPVAAAADSRSEMDDSANASPPSPPPPPPPHQPLQHHAATTTTAGDASNAHQAQQTHQHQQQQQQQDQQTQYLVAAAVIENEAMIVRPYADDILKLVVTLPVEGQTQNVQFDFHLVLDDPVQVAKEMVRELGIPQAAVLEISETISGLACAARMKQDKHNQLQQQQQQLRQPPPQQQHLMPQAASSAAQGAVQQNGSQQEIPHTLSQVSSASPIPDYGANAISVGIAPPPAHLKIPDASIAAPNQTGHPPPVYAPAPQSASYATAPGPAPVLEPQVATQQYGQTQISAGGASQAPLQNANVVAPQPQGSSVPATHSVHGLPPPAPATPQQSPPQTVVGVQHAAPHMAPTTNHVSASWQQQQQPQAPPPQAPAPPGPSTPPQESRLEHEMTVTFQEDGERSVPLRTRSHSSTEQSPRSTPKTVNGVAPVDIYGAENSDSDDDDDDDELNEELRKLEEDFHKNLERTKKVFDSRMDNLARSQIEREAQHLKTLEKHEKERAEFEKRRAIEEEQQQRRLEQLQKEWDKKRETLALHKRKHHGHMTGGSGTDQEAQSEQHQQQQKNAATPLAPKNGSHYSTTTEDNHERPPLGFVPQKPGNPSRNLSTASAALTTAANAANVSSSPGNPLESKHQAPNGGLDR